MPTNTVNYTRRGAQIYYGPNNRKRVLSSKGGVTSSFARSFRRGNINNLPAGILYNSVTKRFYTSRRQIPRAFRGLEEHNGILAPGVYNVFDYDISRVDQRTTVRQYPTPTVRSKGARAVEVGSMWSKAAGMKVVVNQTSTQGLRSLEQIKSFTSDIKQLLRQHNSIKVFFSAVCLFTNGDEEWKPHINPHGAFVFNNPGEIRSRLAGTVERMTNLIETTETQGSGWVFQRVLRWEMTYSLYEPLVGGTYVKLPAWIADKKACINVKTDTPETLNKCALYACLASLYPVKKDGQKPYKYNQHLNDLDFSMVQFPVKHDDRTWSTIEDANNINVNIFTADNQKKVIYPWRVSKRVVPEAREIDLLLITNTDKTKWHYVCIRDISRMYIHVHVGGILLRMPWPPKPFQATRRKWIGHV